MNAIRSILSFALLLFVMFAITLGLITPAHATDGFYIEMGVSVHKQHSTPARETVTFDDGYVASYQPYYLYDINKTKNPYIVATIGYQLPLTHSIDLSASLRHESSVATGCDHGTDSALLSVRWYPFGGAQ